MVEVLSIASAVDDDGDVKPFADVFSDPDANVEKIVADSDAASSKIFYDQRAKALQEAHSGSFGKRNGALLRAARLAGQSNQSWGAGQLRAMDRGGHIRGAETAAERSLAQQTYVRELARWACQACPLAEFCDITGDDVANRLLAIGSTGQKYRRRFKNRVGGRGINVNNRFCQDNLSDKRLPRL